MAKQIPLTQGKFAVVDDQDYEWLSQWKWHYSHSRNTGYAVRWEKAGKGKQAKIRMHRVILRAPDDALVDHIDGDGLNNQRSNLRLCSLIDNARNSSGAKGSTSVYKGVSWDKQSKGWRSTIYADGKTHHLGIYLDEVFAAKVYDLAAKAHHSDFARLNFPDEPLISWLDAQKNRIRQPDGSSPYRGVYWSAKHRKWVAAISLNNKKMFLGYFDNEHEAAHAYNKAVIRWRSKDTPLNPVGTSM